MHVNHQRVRPGDTLRIECIARGTAIIRWVSSALLAENADLFCLKDGDTSQNTIVNGVALFLNKKISSDDDGIQTLMCNLTFQVPRNIFNISDSFSITCLNHDLGVGVDTTFQRAGRFL